MNLIDKIIKRREGARVECPVPEWGETLYFAPISPNDIREARERSREQGIDPETAKEDNRVTLLFLKAELEDGTKAFRMGDRVKFMESVEWPTLQRVLAVMYSASFAGGAESLEDAKKKSEKTTKSEPSS